MTFKAKVKKVFIQTKGEFFLVRLLCVFIEFYFTDSKKALELIEKYLQKTSKNIDAFYLKSEILSALGKNNEAFKLLEFCLLHSKRLKTWIELSKRVKTEKEMIFLEALFEKYKNKAPFALKEEELLKSLSFGAMKVRDYDKVKGYLKQSLFLCIKKHKLPLKSYKTRKITSKNFQEALWDLNSLLKAYDILMFLVSVTFLACVREKRFISYDKDIDVGVFGENFKRIKELILNHQKFIIVDEVPNYLVINHINGVCIDIFVHYEKMGFYHNGHYQAWKNTPFKLIEYEFFGKNYLAPENYELYLSENYGKDWREPKDFRYYNTLLDTPNSEIINSKMYVCFLYPLLMGEFALFNEEQIL
ncbi:TPA: hypothetical protein RTG68_001501 [Campylobacter jejuni]|nr:hypothetical protein [Campylobacter jejuni]HDZ5149831.1 hypothetical protein [Campylobacter jejuni]